MNYYIQIRLQAESADRRPRAARLLDGLAVGRRNVQNLRPA